MMRIWPPTTCPHASSTGNERGMRRHWGNVNPWMDSAHKALFSPWISMRKYCLWRLWDPVARPKQTAGSVIPPTHNWPVFLYFTVPDHHITTTMFDWCNWTHTFEKVQHLSHQSTEYLPESLGDNQHIFWQMWDEPLCTFWSAVTYALDGVFAQSLSYRWIINTEFNWGKCSSLDVVLGSFMSSWMSRHCTLGVILVGRPLLGRFSDHWSKFSSFVDNSSDLGLLESQSLRNGFITLSRQIHVNYFVSHLFLNFFRSRHDVLLFKHASLCQTG